MTPELLAFHRLARGVYRAARFGERRATGAFYDLRPAWDRMTPEDQQASREAGAELRQSPSGLLVLVYSEPADQPAG